MKFTALVLGLFFALAVQAQTAPVPAAPAPATAAPTTATPTTPAAVVAWQAELQKILDEQNTINRLQQKMAATIETLTQDRDARSAALLANIPAGYVYNKQTGQLNPAPAATTPAEPSKTVAPAKK
jgi:Skp family chaperone for outer membrane proteins